MSNFHLKSIKDGETGALSGNITAKNGTNHGKYRKRLVIKGDHAEF